MQVVWLEIVDQVLGHKKVRFVPAMDVHQLSHAFASGEAKFVAIRAREVSLVVLGEDPLGFEDV